MHLIRRVSKLFLTVRHCTAVVIPVHRPQYGCNQLVLLCRERNYPEVVRTGFILDDPNDSRNAPRTHAGGEATGEEQRINTGTSEGG